MADHVRTQIRAAIVSALTGLPTTDGRVYSGRTKPLAADHQPLLLVYVTQERAEVHTMTPPSKLLRTLTVVVEGRVVATGAAAAADLEETLDQIANEVEPAMVDDPSLGGIAKAVTLTSTRIAAQSPGEAHAGEIRMEFEVVYRTREDEPDVAA